MPEKDKPPLGFFATLLVYAILFVAAELLRPKPDLEDARPDGLGDFKFPTATEGRHVPLIWGTNKLEGPNVLWYGDLRQVAITEEVETGLFSGSESVIVGYQYFVGVQMGLCRGPIDEISKVWIGEDIVWSGPAVGDGGLISFDDPDFFGGEENGNGGVKADMRVFGGTTTQQPSTYLNSISLTAVAVNSGGTGYTEDDVLTISGGVGPSATVRVVSETAGVIDSVELLSPGNYTILPGTPANVTGGTGSGATMDLTFGTPLLNIGNFSIPVGAASGNSPGYRGTCHVLPDEEPFYVGNSSSVKPWKFEVKRIPNGLGLSGGDEEINGADANPANVIYELLTDDDWGMNQSAADIDTASFTAAASTLATEGNGFSMVLDRPMEAVDFLREVERQIDGVVFFNQLTAKWEIVLARDDYVIGSVPKINAGVGVEVQSFSRGSWEDTTNITRAQFNDRDDDYKTTFGLAQDMGNIRNQGGTNVSTTSVYPGVKDRTLANTLAWRGLRTVSYPLAKATVILDRALFDLKLGEVIAFSDTSLGITDLPMRVTRLNYGTLEDGRMRVDLVQDIFLFRVGSFGDPLSSGWDPPADDLLPFLAAEQVAFEAPRALVQRNPRAPGSVAPLVSVAARRRGAEYKYVIRERHSAGTPSGAFTEVGTVFGFMRIGALDAALAVGTATPTTSILINPDPDDQDDLEEAFADGLGESALGTGLRNLIYVDDGSGDGEYMIVSSAETSGPDVQLNNVYRGVLDTVQQAWSAGASVYLVFVGQGLTISSFPETDNVDVKLLPTSGSDQVDESAATTIQFQMDKRVRRPYPPSILDLNSVEFDTTNVSLEGVGSDGEDYAIEAVVNRRDYRRANGQDEIEMLETDAAVLDPSFPAENTTTTQIDVRNDPAGSNTFLFTEENNSTTLNLRRWDILRQTNGVLPTTLRVVVRGSHDDGGETLTSRQELVLDFTVVTALTGDFNFGALDNGDISNVYTATETGNFTFDLSSAFTAGDVEYRLNGGSWTQLIAAGSTSSGNIAVSNTDTIEIRHLSTDTDAEKHLTMTSPSTQDGYAILYT